MSLGSLVRGRREELGLTQEMVSAQVNISKPYLSNIETGKARNPPSDGVVRSLERALTFKPGELLSIAHHEKTPTDVRERIEALRAENHKLRAAIKQKGGRKPRVGKGGDVIPAGVVVPVINRVTASSYPHHFTDLDYPAGIADEYIRCPDVHDPQAFAARVLGDSMAPDYREGDLVVFSPALEPRSGDDCFVRFGGDEGTTFKRIYMDDKDTFRLQPLNATYPATVYPRADVTGLWPALFRVQRIRES